MTIQDYSLLFPWQLNQYCVIYVMCIPQGYKGNWMSRFHGKMPMRMGQKLCYTYIAYMVG